MPVEYVELRAIISDFQAKMAEARGEMAKTSKEGGGSLQSLGKFAGLGLAAVGAAAVAVGTVAVKAASSFEDAQTRLNTAITDTGHTMASFQPQITATDLRMAHLGFNQTQVADALANMTTGLGSTSKALNLIGLAADLARFKHIDLATAATLVTKASEGNLRALKAVGIDIPVVASSAEKLRVAHQNLAKAIQAANDYLAQHKDALDATSKSHAAYEKLLGTVATDQQKLNDQQTAGTTILQALSQKMGGQASAYAQTFGGKLEAVKASTENLAIQFGLVLIPILEKVMTVVSAVIGWFEKHRQVAIVLAGVVGGLLVAATVAWVISLGPVLLTVGAVIIAIGALVAAALWLANNWSRVWSDIKNWFDDALRFLRSGFGTLALLILGPFAPLALLALHWQQVWGGIKSVTSDVVNWISGVPSSIVGFFSQLPADIGNVFVQIGRNIANGIIWGLNNLIYAWDTVASALSFSLPSWIPGIGGKTFGLPTVGYIPSLDTGGFITRTGLAVVHQGETVVPANVNRGAQTGPSGDLVVNLFPNGPAFARVAGPELRTWFLQSPARNAPRVL